MNFARESMKRSEELRALSRSPITDLPKDTQVLDFKNDLNVFPLS
jgi:hypothetical protein